MLVDVHAHLEMLKNLDRVISDAKKIGVVSIIAQGINHETNLKVLEFAKKYDIVQPALGIYPLEALNVKSDYPPATKVSFQDTLDFIRQNKDKIFAIGEVGIDYKYSKDKVQEENFRKIMDLAEEIKKPCIIHTRNAEAKALEILESYSSNHILHCFSGKKQLVQKASEMGLYFSIPTNITRLRHFQELVDKVKLSQLLTETDAPYLSPFKDVKNESKFIIEAVKKIAEIKQLTLEDTKSIIYQNYQRLFL